MLFSEYYSLMQGKDGYSHAEIRFLYIRVTTDVCFADLDLIDLG